MRRQCDSNSSTHGPTSRPWRLRTISDADSIVSIFNTRNQLYFRLRKYNLETPAASFDDEAGLMPAV
jgi:hypothetical protein